MSPNFITSDFDSDAPPPFSCATIVEQKSAGLIFIRDVRVASNDNNGIWHSKAHKS